MEQVMKMFLVLGYYIENGEKTKEFLGPAIIVESEEKGIAFFTPENDPDTIWTAIKSTPERITWMDADRNLVEKLRGETIHKFEINTDELARDL